MKLLRRKLDLFRLVDIRVFFVKYLISEKVNISIDICICIYSLVVKNVLNVYEYFFIMGEGVTFFFLFKRI